MDRFASSRAGRGLVRWTGAALGLAAALSGGRARGQEPPAAAATPTARAEVTAAPSAAPAASSAPVTPADADRRVVAARALEARLLALAGDRLDVAVDPRSLFDVDLDDDQAVAVEVRRLRAVVQADEVGGAGGGAAAADALFAARIAVDRARLAFLERAPDERRTHLDVHAARQAAAEAEQPEVVAQREAQQKAQLAAEEAAAERRRALAQMDAAQSEARRLVARERARLLGVREAQSTFEATLLGHDERRAERAEHVLALRRRVEELIAADPPRPSEEANVLYDELRAVLRAARGDLADALVQARRDDSDVPVPGPDRLGELSADRAEIDRLRTALWTRAEALIAAERAARWARVRHVHETVTVLNQDRHALYPSLPPERRAGLTGFSAEGRDQARGEVEQLRLVMAYQVAAAGRLARGGGLAALARDALLAPRGLELLALLALFLWWRRAARRTIAGWAEPAPPPTSALGARLEPWRARAVAIAARVHQPLALLVVLRIALAMLGPEVAERLEVQLGWILVRWSLGGLVVVHAVDGLFAPRRGEAEPGAEPLLRLRSLRLIGRIAVVLGLVLDLSAAIVGRGTLYVWVLRTCWIAIVPVALVLLRWWRPTIARRTAARAKQSAVARWVAVRPTGGAGFLAAAVGGGYLLAVGAARLARSQMAAFDATRRVLAYLFRREILRTVRADEAGGAPLPAAARAALDPDEAPPEVVLGVGDAELGALEARLDGPRGGVVAVVGERGGGKSTLARRLAEARAGVVIVRTPPGGADALRALLLAAIGLPPEATDDALVARLRGDPGDAGDPPPIRAIVIDDAQRLVLPAVGGLDRLDALLALARAASARCTWIVCFGAVMWQFVERARGVRPLFDEVIRTRPWTEDQIGELLRRRCAAAGIAPSFRGLHDEHGADDDERAELARRTEADYHRLLWDASGGNPAVALHFWRDALRVADDGAVVVSLFAAPDARELQRLPTEMVFVLRAVLRLERVAPADVARSTLVALPVVHEAIHFATQRGWLEDAEGRYRVTWTWLRAVTVFLQRRRLLVGAAGEGET